MSNTTAEERMALASAAKKATTGIKQSAESIEKKALAYEAKGFRGISVDEDMFASHLVAKGINFTRQKAIGKYNTDFAIGSIAVEIFGGQWHWYGAHIKRTEERFNYIMNSGFNILVIACTQSFPLNPAICDYISSYLDEASRNPPEICEYRVIWGAGEYTTGGCLNDNNFSIHPPFTRARNRTTGRYETVPR
jgi:very-short-patch-repair endonuclease